MLCRFNINSYNNIVSFGSSKRKSEVANKSSAETVSDVFVKNKSPQSQNKAYRIAEVLPKVKVTQNELDAIFSEGSFAKEVLDRDWFNQWKIAMIQKTILPSTGCNNSADGSLSTYFPIFCAIALAWWALFSHLSASK